MKKEINIYSNITYPNFFKKILPKYNLRFNRLDELTFNVFENDRGGIILNKDLRNIQVKLDILSKNYLIITNDKKIIKLKKNIQILNPPIFPYQLENSIESFLTNNSLQVGDLSIFDQKIKNLENNKVCSLTELENKILIYIIKNENCTKEAIKQSILNIKPSIETNSVDSHLTRIRKKFHIIKTKSKIKSKNSLIYIDFIQKNLG